MSFGREARLKLFSCAVAALFNFRTDGFVCLDPGRFGACCPSVSHELRRC